MQDGDIPAKFPIPWANGAGGGFIRPIPEASQIGIQNGAASLTDGYPPLNFDPVGAGGVPPFGQDTNGILNQITAWSRWMQACAPVQWDSSFASDIGGYPKGAVVQSATYLGKFWISTIDNNASNPDSGTNWLRFPDYRVTLFDTPGVTAVTMGPYTNWADVELVAGGAGSSGTDGTFLGGCGGAGGYSRKLVAVTPGGVYPLIVGAAGLAGASGTHHDGGNGGVSSFGSGPILSASGGLGGAGANPSLAGGQGGNGFNGDVNCTGGCGSNGNTNSMAFGLGLGGASFFGGGGRSSDAFGDGSATGQAPGSGAGAIYGAVPNPGFVGAAGLVIVRQLA